MSNHTPGPWRWEVNMKSKSLNLVGGKPMFDLTIIEPTRWGMGGATLMIRDTAHDGMNIMHKLHERDDWWQAFPGRGHHADWCAAVKHPDMQLIEAAPDLLAALVVLVEEKADYMRRNNLGDPEREGATKQARAAIAKAAGVVLHNVANNRPAAAERIAEDRQAALEKDAQRYRKLRRGNYWIVVDGDGDLVHGDALDAALDATPAVGAA